MRLFSGPAAGAESNVSRKKFAPSHQQSSTTSSRTTRTATTRSMAWSLFCTLIILNTFLAFLSPSTSGGRALAAPEAGFCADCKTFSNAIGVCGGTFGPADIEKPGEYVLQQGYAKCTCTAAMQRVLWNCGKCEFLAGKGSSGVPPKKHQMTCMSWGITVTEYAAPYTGVVEPGTTADLGGGTPNPPPTATTTNNVNPPPTGNPKPSSDGGNKPPGSSTDPSLPSSSQDNLNGDKNTSETGNSGPNTAAIGISVGIIGVALIAGVMAVVMMKRRRRRRSPLDLDSSPALANFVALEDKWDTKPSRQPPTSPPLPAVPVASAAPVIGGRGNGRNGGYGDGSVVGGGYDAQYDAHYDAYGHHGGYDAQYDAYGHGGQGGYGGQQQYDHYDQGGQYDQGRYDQGYDQGYHPGQPDAYQMHDYGYDQHVVSASQQHGPPPKGDAKRPL